MTASPLAPDPTTDGPGTENHPHGPASADPVTAPVTARLSRYRMHTDRPGLRLRAGEVILGVPYALAEATMVMPVRCESDGHNPGALLSTEELEDLGPTDQLLGPYSWGKAGVRP
ncbi:hypothetical protein ACH9EU_08715 [Kocuria sp. M1R5S2]|uniref:hypothetical protein n=1 Tax=Kocuria rhizosphaerae TaxID=3376285 RepID=UPI0037B34064